MSCACPGASYTVDSADDMLRRELGPAYQDYKDGKVNIPIVWRQDQPVVPNFVPECCTDLKPDFKWDEKWAEHTAMMVVFVVVATVLLGIFIFMRDEQPYKFRDYRAVILLWATLLFNMIISVYLGNTGGTAEVELDVLLRFIGPILILYYYIMKNLQLNFIYSWQAAKLKKSNAKNIDKITRFHRFRSILSFRTYLIGFVGVFLFCLTPALYTLYGRDTFSKAIEENKNTYMTARCAWFKFPDEYVNPPNQSQLCECVKMMTPLEGGSVETCGAAMMSVCSPTYTERTPEEDAFCQHCPAGLQAQNPSQECRTIVGQQFFYAGECGWLKYYPYARYCTTGIFADHTGETICAVWNYLFLGINLIVMYPLFGKRDEFGMIYENLTSSIVQTVSMFFLFAGLIAQTGKELDDKTIMSWYYDDLDNDYRAEYLFMWISNWTSMVFALGFPSALYFYRECVQKWWKARRHGHKGGPERSTEVADKSRPKSSMNSSSMLDDAEQELDLLVRNNLLLAIYEKFALEAFHAENIRFLEECARLTDLGHIEQPTSEQLAEILRLADDIYQMYIVAGSLMEVNVQARRRESIKRALDDLKAVMNRADPEAGDRDQVEMKEYAVKANIPADQAAKQLEALMAAYNQAYFDIRILLARDSWPRFRLSRYFPQYKRATTEERQTSIAVGMMTGGGRREGKQASDEQPGSPHGDDSPRTKRGSDSDSAARNNKRNSESNHSSSRQLSSNA